MPLSSGTWYFGMSPLSQCGDEGQLSGTKNHVSIDNFRNVDTSEVRYAGAHRLESTPPRRLLYCAEELAVEIGGFDDLREQTLRDKGIGQVFKHISQQTSHGPLQNRESSVGGPAKGVPRVVIIPGLQLEL